MKYDMQTINGYCIQIFTRIPFQWDPGSLEHTTSTKGYLPSAHGCFVFRY